MKALWSAATSWLRWHLPVTREASLRFAEQEAGCYFEVLERKTRLLFDLVELLTPDDSRRTVANALAQAAHTEHARRERHLRVVKS